MVSSSSLVLLQPSNCKNKKQKKKKKKEGKVKKSFC